MQELTIGINSKWSRSPDSFRASPQRELL